MTHDPIYFLTNYGKCGLEKCRCIDPDNPRFGGPWGGLVCPDWLPHGAIDMEALKQYARDTYKKAKDAKVQG